MKVADPDENGCRRWLAYRHPVTGYGQFNLGNGATGLAHRVAYTLVVGPIPEGKQLDHTCCNKWCVEPTHLEPVTQAENSRRAGVGGNKVSKTHCPQGHPYDDENTYRYPSGHRRCRTCARAQDDAYRERRAAADN